jgi:hypothetical protein
MRDLLIEKHKELNRNLIKNFLKYFFILIMKVDNFVLLIISIVTSIIISLVTECNRGRLKELEDKATQEIKETFFGHFGSADPTEPGQKGFFITDITEGKYGGRTRQQVIDSIGNHSKYDYISYNDYNSYNSKLFNSPISGIPKNPIPCSTFPSTFNCNKCHNNKLAFTKDNWVSEQYGGSCMEPPDDIVNNTAYKYVDLENLNACDLTQKTLLKLNIVKNGNSIKINNIIEPNWCGFINTTELKDILPLYDNISKYSNFTDINTIVSNYNNSNLLKNISYPYKKFTKTDINGNNTFYEVDYSSLEYTFTSKKTGRIGAGTWGGRFKFNLPLSGRWRITAYGANGFTSKGYKVSAIFNINHSFNLYLIVGQSGITRGDGAGGSFVFITSFSKLSDLLIAAGGGGGDGKVSYNVYVSGGNAGYNQGSPGESSSSYSGGAGGNSSNPNGGQRGLGPNWAGGGGGAGIDSDGGTLNSSNGGIAIKFGAKGGGQYDTYNESSGGFGGGGQGGHYYNNTVYMCSGGGGGGYSGGDGGNGIFNPDNTNSCYGAGGGGGSSYSKSSEGLQHNVRSNDSVHSLTDTENNNGRIIIKYLGP